eukprot:4066473-Amphidinium_carterae.1
MRFEPGEARQPFVQILGSRNDCSKLNTALCSCGIVKDVLQCSAVQQASASASNVPMNITLAPPQHLIPPDVFDIYVSRFEWQETLSQKYETIQAGKKLEENYDAQRRTCGQLTSRHIPPHPVAYLANIEVGGNPDIVLPCSMQAGQPH